MCTDYEGPKPEQKAEIERKLRQEITGFVPRARIRPTDRAPILVPEEDAYVCREMRWGWHIPWDKGPLVNAKSETLTTLPTFKPHLDQRCLILARSFKEGGAQFHQPDWIVFCLAGLWRVEPSGPRFVMLTTTPNDSVAPFHSRMPFLLHADQYADWLRGDFLKILTTPDKSPLEKFQPQPDLF